MIVDKECDADGCRNTVMGQARHCPRCVKAISDARSRSLSRNRWRIYIAQRVLIERGESVEA